MTKSIFVLCNSDSLAIPTILKLKDLGWLSGIGIIEKSRGVLSPALEGLSLDLIVLERRNWVTELSNVLVTNKIDTVWVLTFPWKIPIKLLEIPPMGFVNFHFGILPKYKGIDPIFWQFKNLEKNGGLTVHLMNEEIDEGPVLLQELVSIAPGENYGFHCMRLGNTTPTWVERIIDAQNNKEFQYLALDNPNEIFDQKPTQKDLTIDWERQSAEQIELLVNACNPKYGGAKASVSNIEMYILEVTPVTIENQSNAAFGQIVHADAVYGLVVQCSDGNCIRITVVRTREGYLSGVKLFNLGFGAGHKFD
jgi:methionyl-tRNA formyltransferase